MSIIKMIIITLKSYQGQSLGCVLDVRCLGKDLAFPLRTKVQGSVPSDACVPRGQPGC